MVMRVVHLGCYAKPIAAAALGLRANGRST
jgi:hypothetical protein